MPQYCQGKTHIADNRRKIMNPDVKLEKLRDIEEDDIVRLLAHRAPGEEYKSIHPPLEEMEEQDCAVRHMVEPTEGAKKGDLIRCLQFTDSMFFAPVTPYQRACSAYNRYRGVDIGVSSGSTIIEARERDLEKIAKELIDSELYDTARTGLRGRTVDGHSLRLDEKGMMFDALRRWSQDEHTKEVTYVKDMIGGAMDKEVVLGKPLSASALRGKTTMYRNAQGGVWQEEDDPESMDVCAEIHWKRTVGGFQPWRFVSEIKGGKKDVGVKDLKLFVPRGGVVPSKLQSEPTFYTIEQPKALNYVRMDKLFAYMVQFKGETNELKKVHRFRLKKGKFCDYNTGNPTPIDCGRDAWFYFSHREDLIGSNNKKWFAKDGSGLPLLGPIHVPCGQNVKIELNIWDQKDWVIVRGPPVDGKCPDGVKMAEWQENYNIGRLGSFTDNTIGFFPYGEYLKKENQEKWKGGSPIELVHLGNPNGNPMWVGTLSALPTDKAKLLLVHKFASSQTLYAASYNEIVKTKDNLDLPGYHVYNQELVKRLISLPRSIDGKEQIKKLDALRNPPKRCLLSGDMCWQNQGKTNDCGPYSLSTAMNYWYPYTNNPVKRKGAYYAGKVNDVFIIGGRTPADIVEGAKKFRMNARDNDAEELDKERALKLVKLWILAGVPVLILVEENYDVWSLHWKTVVGYDGDRFFMNNSGADNECVRSRRTPNVNYEKAPVGNDVDSEKAFWDKWKAAGGDIFVDTFTSVDECTFIPIYPQDSKFAGKKAQ